MIKHIVTFTLIAIASHTALFSDELITGTILDARRGEPLENVNVLIQGTQQGTATDKAGRFIIPAESNDTLVLNISHIGYESKVVPVAVPEIVPLVIKLTETFFEMNSVVITATRTPKILQNVPVATEIITSDEIYTSGARDVGELLSQRSGVSVSSSVAGGSIVNLMGMDSKYILILVDGQPVVGKFNSRVSLDQFPTNNIQRVEIIKGPNSSLYGSEAMGGVINIITRNEIAKQFTTSFRYDGGDGTFNPADLGIGNRSLKAEYSNDYHSLKYLFNIQGDFINVDQTKEYIELDDVGKNSVSGKIDWEMTDRQRLKNALSLFKDTESSHTSTGNTKTIIDRKLISLTHNWDISSNWILTQFARYSDYSRQYRQIYPWGEIKSVNNTLEAESEYEISGVYSTATCTFNVGGEAGYARYESDRISHGSQTLRSNSLYVQYDFNPVKRLNLVIGNRLDDNSEIPLVYSPRVAAMVSIGARWKIRAMWGNGFRMPTFMDRYIDWSHIQFGYHVIGNPDLKPEQSNGYTFGVEYYHPGVYRVSTMIYRTYFDNMISDYSIPNTNVLTYKNIDEVRYTGVELQGYWNVSPEWVANWGLNYVDNTDLKTGEVLPNTQPFSGNLQLRHRHSGNRFQYSFKLKWIGSYYPMEYIPDTNEFYTADQKRNSQYFLDYSAKFQFTHSLQLEGGIKNMTNYTNSNYGPFIGRTYYMELVLTLNGVNNEK